MIASASSARARSVVGLTCAAVLTVGTVVAVTTPSVAAPPASAGTAAHTPVHTSEGDAVVRHLALGDGTRITVTADGVAKHLGTHGKVLATQLVPAAVATPLGATSALSDSQLRTLFAPTSGTAGPGAVIAVLGSSHVRANATTSDPTLDAALRSVHATAVHPLLSTMPSSVGAALRATVARGAAGVDLSSAVVVDVPKGTSATAAATLQRTPGVGFAEADRYVSGLSTGAVPLKTSGTVHADASDDVAGLPTNFGLTSSLQSFLNAGGVDAMGAYSELTSRYGQLPGTGERITNVSVGDLTDASMEKSDPYVKAYGPTTVVQDGQRYLDLPSLPLIPTYTSDDQGSLDPTGTVEGVDPTLDEVLLDFGVMAPLPHDQQRAGSIGAGVTDLLGIAPGADYRLVVPQDPTTDQIAVALLAAARQTPRPDVITASLGFGTDTVGFPGRYLEDDPVTQAVIATIVSQYHVVVSISSNDGTRLYTPASVGPDGGSTPTDLASSVDDATSIGDDALSTTPSRVLDSGAIAAGGTTLDDTLAVSPDSARADTSTATFATTRTDGSGVFSSGFGSRVDVSAPSDGIVVYEHKIGGNAGAVSSVINGGTSASAPEVGASAAVLLQAARLAGTSLTPEQVRATLEKTGRTVATPPQIDRHLQVGNQVDLTAAVNSVLPPAAKPAIARVSVAHRVTQANLGGEFTEDTDQHYIDLSGGDPASGTPDPGAPTSGLGLLGPITIAGDVTGLRSTDGVTYQLGIGTHDYTSTEPSIRLLPKVMLHAAGLPVVSDTDRTLKYTFAVLQNGKVVASQNRSLTFGPTDGTFVEAPAPVVPPTVRAGQPVTVHYDLRGVRSDELSKPELVVSHIGHWNPVLSPVFSAADRVKLKASHGTVTFPASDFSGGGGIYGIGYVQLSSDNKDVGHDVYGEFSSIRVIGSDPSQRPEAPTVGTSASPTAHQVEVTDASPRFTVGWDVGDVAGATGALVEISAPAPTLYGALNTVTNQDGTKRDRDGVDSGAVLERPVLGTEGSVELSATALELVGSDDYNVRVLATDSDGTILGQASPSSFLAYDDGFPPNAYLSDTFAAARTGESIVDTRDQYGASTLRTYSTATGRYGHVLATDPDADDAYDVVGLDQSRDRAVVMHFTSDGDSVDTYAPATGDLIASVRVKYTLVAGRIDATRHRAVLLARDRDGNDVVLPVSTDTGAVKKAIPVDVDGAPAGTFRLMTLDESTGDVLLSGSAAGPICFAGFGYLATVDVDTRTATVADGQRCVTAMSDDDNGTAYELGYRSFSVNIAGTSTLLPIDESTSTFGDAISVRQQYPLTLAIDGVHHLALVAFTTPKGIPHFGSGVGIIDDNNATSTIAEVDLTTGKVTKTIGGFDFLTGLLNFAPSGIAEQGVQLDPKSRTGWTFSPDDEQIQHFHY